jgi:hypothetical protein
MKTADIEHVIGHKPGANGFKVTAANIANVRDWMVSQGISRDRANACRASTLEIIYRNPLTLRKLLVRGDYVENWRKAAQVRERLNKLEEKGLTNDSNGTEEPSAMGANAGAQQQEHALATTALEPDTTGEGIGAGSGQASLTNTIEGIVCGEFADDDVVRLLDACKAHLGE